MTKLAYLPVALTLRFSCTRVFHSSSRWSSYPSLPSSHATMHLSSIMNINIFLCEMNTFSFQYYIEGSLILKSRWLTSLELYVLQHKLFNLHLIFSFFPFSLRIFMIKLFFLINVNVYIFCFLDTTFKTLL